MTDYLSTTHVGLILGVSARHVLYLLDEGRITGAEYHGVRPHGRWRIPPEFAVLPVKDGAPVIIPSRTTRSPKPKRRRLEVLSDAQYIEGVKALGPVTSADLAAHLGVTYRHVAHRMPSLHCVRRVIVRNPANHQQISAWYIPGYGKPPTPLKANPNAPRKVYNGPIGVDDEHLEWMAAGRRSREERARRVEALGLCKE